MSNNRYDRRHIRKAEAEIRQTAWGQLTAVQQLASLDYRLGENLGAKRQRQRIKRKAAK